MAYCKVKPSYITMLQYSWSEYCSRTKMSIERAAGYAQHEISWEARVDLREKKYSTASILECQRKDERALKEWKDDLIDTIDKKDRIMKSLINELANKKFYSADSPYSDYGKKYILSIHKEQFYFVTIPENNLYVYVDELRIEGDFAMHSFCEVFKPPKVEFDSWVY